MRSIDGYQAAILDFGMLIRPPVQQLIAYRTREPPAFPRPIGFDVPVSPHLADHHGHHVGVHVGGGPTVLKVTLLFLVGITADADGCATVGHTIRKLRDRRGFVRPRKAPLVTLR